MDKVLRGALKSIALAKCIDGSVKNHWRVSTNFVSSALV
jgi:hypothetical protein